MAKKNENVFEELVAQYAEYAERRAELLKSLNADRERYQTELSEIQRQLSKEANTMTAEAYRIKKERMDEIFKEMKFIDERLQGFKNSSAVTDEEYDSWQEKAVAEDLRLRSKLKSDTHSFLKELAAKYEEYITEIEKINALRYNFEGAIGKRQSPSSMAKNLPPFAKAVMRLLLVYYNEIDKDINEGQQQTECYDREKIREAHKEIQQVGKQVGFSSVGGVDVPSWQEAYNELKYNKPWAV